MMDEQTIDVQPEIQQAIIKAPHENSLAVERDPDKVLAEAKKAAQALKRVIDAKPKKVIFNGKTYLEYEDWLTVARFYGVTARVKSTSYIELGDSKGFEATAEALLVSTGQIVSQADAMCMNDEDNWGTRKKYRWVKNSENGKAEKVVESESPVPMFQLRSMAQTRACAKALRNVLAWVVVLAGYAPTPAEEMGELIEDQNTKGSAEAQKAVVDQKLADIDDQKKETSQGTQKGCISQPQQKRLWAIAKQAGWQNDEIKSLLKARYGLEHTKDVPKDKYEEICNFLEAGSAPPQEGKDLPF